MTLANAVFSLDYAVKQARIVSKNVVGRIEGRTRPNETILYGAHWDHLGIGAADARGDSIYNGAVDNGTGIAAVLELARLFAAGPKPQRSVVFAFWTAEEKGLLGSEYYAANPVYPLETTVAGWDPDATSRRIEIQIGKDLQFIRINGTVVGGLVGLLLYTIQQFM